MSWSMKDTLLHCGPWEILPDDRPKVEAAARRYSKDLNLGKRDRDHISRTWLPADEAAASMEDQSVEGRYLASIGEDGP